MGSVIRLGTGGGLQGTAPPREPGTTGLDDPPKQRRQLTSEDRAVIAAGLRACWSYDRIGAELGRDKSVVCREVARNRGPDGSYRGPVAHRAAHERRRRPREFRLVAEPGLCRRIETWMDEGWSPKLIARVLREESPHMIMGRVSHETIYQALYVQARGSLRKDLYRQLSTKRPRRKPQGGAKRANSPYQEAFKISQRPAEVADRAVPGHWEGDLVMGTAGGVAVGTLVERSTRFTILLHLPGRHDAETVAAAMVREMSHLPEHLRLSLTWDRGTELARYDKVQLELEMPVYFCDPHSPWQRGTNENTNRLLRHWLTKGTDLSRFSAADLRRIAASLNARPRPTLDMRTPAQALDALLTNPAAA
jgi:transposase, IS30 family